jgi:hypothetical protein
MPILDEDVMKYINLLENPRNNKIEFIKNSYANDYNIFHQAFLHSGIAFSLSNDDFDCIIKLLESLGANETYLNQIKFLKIKIKAYNNLNKKIEEQFKNINFYSLIDYIEYLYSRYEVSAISIDGKNYRRDVSDSQINFLLNIYHEIIRESIVNCKNNEQCDNFRNYNIEEYKQFLHNIADKYSLLGFILRVCSEELIPEPLEGAEPWKQKIVEYILSSKFDCNELDCHISEFYYLKDIDKKNEIYRDLNIEYFNALFLRNESKLNEIPGFNLDPDNTLFYSNLQLAGDFLYEKKILNDLFNTYDKYTKFEYKEKEYSLLTLKEIYNKIKDLLDELLDNNKGNIDDNRGYKKSKYSLFIKKCGVKQLIRKLNVVKNSELLELFVWDIRKEVNKKSEYRKKLILKDNKLYYIMPYFGNIFSISEIIDNIFSEQKITKTLSIKKGSYFEENLMKLFKKNFSFYKTKKGQCGNFPEIDGMFGWENALFIYEAKTSVLPRNEMERYNNLKSTIHEAYLQLVEKIDFILSNETIRKVLNEKLGLTVSKNKIYPLIVTNHATFSGYNKLFVNSIEKIAPVTDYETLRYLIINMVIPYWRFDVENGKYCLEKKKLQDAFHFHNFLVEPSKYLSSYGNITYQLTKTGIYFPIIKKMKINL